MCYRQAASGRFLPIVRGCLQLWIQLVDAADCLNRSDGLAVWFAVTPCLRPDLEAQHTAHIVLVFFKAPPIYEGCYIARVAYEP